MFQSFSDLSSRFEAAQAKLNTLTEDPGNAAKLKIYGLFKQVCKFCTTDHII